MQKKEEEKAKSSKKVVKKYQKCEKNVILQAKKKIFSDTLPLYGLVWSKIYV